MAEVDHLAAERATARFDVEEMKVAWAGSRHAVHVADRMARLVASDPVFRKDNRTMLSRKELFKDTLRKAAHAWKRIVELRLTGPKITPIYFHPLLHTYSTLSYVIMSRSTEEEADLLRQYVDQPGYVDLHWGMFVPAIKGQGTEEQQHKWLPLAYKFQIIGCYAQTELGHGSNVQGLETTATFDPKTDEFVIHSPTLTSSKWWPGGLGKASTHAVVYARLITEGKDYGIHGFIVQLRSLEDHSPLPGVTLGDIGGKFGSGAYNSMDNGVLRFDHVRIPRDQMLMRLSQVTREGKYVHSNVPKQLLYGTMVYVRQSIVADASKALSRAVCIAVRYSAVRKQFGSQDGGPETQVLNYKTQQSRLFPLLASAYAFRFVGDWLNWLYTDVTQKLEAKDFSTLQEAHACTAGLKAVTTSVTADAIEECRKLCGGHGYLNSSGLPELFAVYVPTCTYEGDNIVLLLQVARILMKTVSQLASGKQPVGTMAYMGKVQYLMQCKSAVSSAAGFYERSPDLLEAAVAHIQLIIVTKFIEKVHHEIPGYGVKEQLQALCNVYALYILHKHLGDFLATGCITPRQGALANEQLGKLYAQVRPNAVALVDAFNYTDHYLGSVLGRYDGDVYPALYEEAWKDPLNETVVPEGYHEYLRPLIKQQQLKLSRL
ncbi:Peroxisomal acyl-coenzyme A oxidase 1 [Zea mays]|uniref:Acyl-coenzyme A oxidase n=1 Tax=Zea mays TaxID=4577 RepID=A0A3L6DHD2_MAIZE|nr:Peroxisomal acyl-coenzyme A oxidase 1 [Zea mays]